MEGNNSFFISHPAVDAAIDRAWAGNPPHDNQATGNIKRKVCLAIRFLHSFTFNCILFGLTLLKMQFYIHILSYMGFLANFATATLLPFDSSFGYYEVILLFFVFDHFIVEMLQLRRLGLKRWFSESWNLMDALLVTFID